MAKKQQRRDTFRRRMTQRVVVMALPAALMWGLLLLHKFWPEYSLNPWAIRPQTNAGLLGIPLAPFLHNDVGHLASNTLPFLVLGGLVLIRSWGEFLGVSFVAIALSGAGAWHFGRPAELHLGASGLIFGYFGFLLARGLFERTLLSLGIAAVVGFLYGGLIWGVFPNRVDVSWQAHVFGFLAGVLSGWFVARKKRQRRRWPETH